MAAITGRSLWQYGLRQGRRLASAPAPEPESLIKEASRPMPPPSDFRDFSKISNFSKNAKNCIFINFWAPGILNSYSAYRSGGKKWPQINFLSKLKIALFVKNIKNREWTYFLIKNCYFINFWAPGMLKSHSAYRKVG